MTPKASKLPKPSPRATKAAAAAAAFAEEAGAASSPSHVQRLKAKNASLKATVAALQKQLANGGGAAPKEGVVVISPPKKGKGAAAAKPAPLTPRRSHQALVAGGKEN